MAIGKWLAKLNPANKGVVPRVTETVEYGLASFGFGYLQNRYRQKASLAGVPADLAVGGAGKLVGLVLDFWKPGKWATVHSQAHLLGNVGLGAFMHMLGAGQGAQASGVVRFLAPKSDMDKVKKAVPGAVVLGAIEKAPHGDFLSSKDLANLGR